MLIVIDQDMDANGRVMNTHFIDTDNMPKVRMLPTDPDSSMLDWPTYLSKVNSTPDLKESGGWNVSQQLPGETAPRSRWQRLVDTVGHPLAPQTLKALNLK